MGLDIAAMYVVCRPHLRARVSCAVRDIVSPSVGKVWDHLYVRRCWLLVAFAACGGPKGPSALPPNASAPNSVAIRSPGDSAPTRAKPQLVPRPTVDVSAFRPDFHDELRWPLASMQHPSFEPSFDVASQLAQGMTWIALCQSGAQRRSGGNAELQQYLRGWCAALSSDISTSLNELMPLLRGRLANNVRLDVANILTNAGDAEDAEHWLKEFKIAREPRIVDLLAAGYLEARTTRDARLINHYAIDNSDRVSAETKCLRWTREIVLSGNRASGSLLAFDASDVAADPGCMKLRRKLLCWADRQACSGYYDDLNVGRDARGVVEAIDAWDDARTPSHWMDVALAASRARNAEGGEVAVAALENAQIVSGSNCGRDIQAVISFVEHRLEKVLPTRADLKSRLSALTSVSSCADTSRDNVSQTVKSKTYAYTTGDMLLLGRDLRNADENFWAAVATSPVVLANFDTLKTEEVCELSDEPRRWQTLLTNPTRHDVTCMKTSDDSLTCVQGPGSEERRLVLMFATAPQFRLTAVIEGKELTSGKVNQLGNAIRSAMTNSRCKSP